MLRRGLQTPRLKRLAEIVSAQALAQQERLDYGAEDEEYEEQGVETMSTVDEGEVAVTQ